jgi:uncharacterized repeat protein (TIGR03803 family)
LRGRRGQAGWREGGGACDEGTIFQYDTSNSQFTLLHSFTDPDDEEPFGDLLRVDSTYYGLTPGVPNQANGALFSFTSVPEPTSLAVLGLGAMVLAGWWRRQGRRGFEVVVGR